MSIVYKMSDVYSLSQDFKEKFKILTDIQEGDKFIVTGDKTITKDINGPLVQSFSRWWNNHNRYQTITILENQVEEYLSFLRFVYGAYKSNNTGIKEKRQLKSIYRQHCGVKKTVILALCTLKLTYKYSEDVVRNLDTMISNLTYLPEIN